MADLVKAVLYVNTNFVYIKKQSWLNEPFKIRAKIDHSKSGHIQISDPNRSQLNLFKKEQLSKRSFFSSNLGRSI